MEGRPDPQHLRRPAETPYERADRNLTELMQELRVAQTGVQVLFAFLLTLPFTARFALSGFQQATYLVALLSAGGATVLLTAPAARHRLLFRRGDKPELLRVSNRYAIGGLAMLAITLVAGVMLVTDALYGELAAICIGIATSLGPALLWLVVPLRRRRALDAEEQSRQPRSALSISSITARRTASLTTCSSTGPSGSGSACEESREGIVVPDS